MNRQRWEELSNNDDREISLEEWKLGWHWCSEFDGLLVGPGMAELRVCKCDNPHANAAKKRTDLLINNPSLRFLLLNLSMNHGFSESNWVIKSSVVTDLMLDAADMLQKIAQERDALYLELQQLKESNANK